MRVTSNGGQCLVKDEIEVWKDWQPGEWDVNQFIKDAEVIDGLPFVKLEFVLEWKRRSGMEKDLKDIVLIETFLNASKARHT